MEVRVFPVQCAACMTRRAFFARTWQSGTMAVLMLIMLMTLLVVGYLA
jgi:hypothetical protein